MNRTKLKNYAPQARRDFIQAMTDRAAYYGLTAKKSEPVVERGDVAVIAGREHPRAVAKKRKQLEDRVQRDGFEQTMEAMAYTWFNRLVAIRYMEMHGYLDHGFRVLSHPEGKPTPQIIDEAEHVELPGLKRETVIELKLAGNKESELYRLLLTAQCNALHAAMPFLFEKIDDETELLLPDNLLHSDSLIRKLVGKIDEEDCQEVEVIGWLYQFYISEKKDDVFAALKKGKKITPENIPAATQLFTPHWIVRYLVENSLGRLWMLNHPDSRLAEQMDYYIRPEEPETNFLRISSPEEIKICDPACGSGHMLTYAFDLMYAIYEEQGYQATDIPRLILTHNLYGIEIDQRAGALAAFALTMKAREKDRRFFTRKPKSDDSLATRNAPLTTQPNICVLENISIDPEDLSAYMDKVGRDLFSDGLQGVVNQWEEADNFGSLIRPRVRDVSEVLESLRAAAVGEDLFLAGVHQKVLKALWQADYLSPKYHVVVANPPYMGRNGMNSRLKTFANDHCEEAKSDLFAMFMDRGITLSNSRGYLAMITMQSWMFLASYFDLRRCLLERASLVSMAHLGPRAFDTISGEIVSTTAFVAWNHGTDTLPGAFLRLVDGTSEADKAEMLRRGVRDSSLRFSCTNNDLRMLETAPIAYWISDSFRHAFSHGRTLEEVATPRQGLATTNNDLFMRFWFEVSTRKTAFMCEKREDAIAAGQKWFPYSKGGPSRRWYGNHDYVVNWQNDGADIKEYIKDKNPNVARGETHYFKPAVTWSLTSSARDGFAARFRPSGFIFDVNGMSSFPVNTLVVAAFLNSVVADQMLQVINPTMAFQVGDLKQLRLLTDIDDASLSELANEAIQVTKQDWDSHEFSWDFQGSPLLKITEKGQLISFVWDEWYNKCNIDFNRVREIQTKINCIFVDAYALTKDCNPISTDRQVTLFSSDKKEDIEEFISYAVGCMLGRYSLDKPGLILANQGETADDYSQQIPEPTFAPDDDNVIPLLDGDWFTDDISERFKEFLKVTFGTEHYEENLTFLENGLYPENGTAKKRKTIRDYFLKDFYNHHIKLYKKRPIYWLFSSGTQQAFQALIYLHRYHEGTLARMRTEYVIPLQSKLAARIDQLEVDKTKATSTSHRNKLQKEQADLKKQQAELLTFEEKLKHAADQKISLDLDDGVKVNYAKFGDLLAEAKAVTGGKDEE